MGVAARPAARGVTPAVHGKGGKVRYLPLQSWDGGARDRLPRGRGVWG